MISNESFDIGLSQNEIEGGKQSMNQHKCLPISFLKGTEAQNNVVSTNAGMAIATVTNVPLLKGFK
jgi:anthranilate phosphoribosyltransferase